MYRGLLATFCSSLYGGPVIVDISTMTLCRVDVVTSFVLIHTSNLDSLNDKS